MRNGARVRFFTAIDLVNQLEAEARAGKAGQLADQLVRVDLVILDELGYLPFPVSGTITTERVDAMWGTDLTSVITGEGQAAVFITVDHCSAECVGLHASRSADRFEALEPIRQGVRERFGAFGNNAASGLALRHDHGSQYVSHHLNASGVILIRLVR